MTSNRKLNEPLRAIAYVRVSTEQQAESGLSLNHQTRKVQALAR